jgi:HD-like signal output (HDOD) protein
MPRMGGLELLQRVRQEPKTKRIPFLMMTARADKPSVIQALKGGANDYIAKPFEGALLLSKIARLLESGAAPPAAKEPAEKPAEEELPPLAKGMSLTQAVQAVFNRGGVKLPVMPDIATKIGELLKDEDVSLKKIVALIEVDPSLSASLITIANSPAYRGAVPVMALEMAVSRLGPKNTRHYVKVLQGRSLFTTDRPEFSNLMQRLWKHSVATAVFSKEIAIELQYGHPDALYAMGQLHDIGALVVLKILNALTRQRDDIDEAAAESLIHDLHGELGARLLKEWDVPASFAEVARFHEDPSHTNNPSREMRIVNLANLLAIRLGYSISPKAEVEARVVAAAKLLRLDEADLDRLQKQARFEIEELLGEPGSGAGATVVVEAGSASGAGNAGEGASGSETG